MYGPDSSPGTFVVYRAEDLDPEGEELEIVRLWFRVHARSDEEIRRERERLTDGSPWDFHLFSRDAVDACYRISLTRWGPKRYHEEPRGLKRVDCPDRVVPVPYTDPLVDVSSPDPVYSGGPPDG